jgi:hypothetical protein
MLNMDDKWGRGVREMLTLAEKGGTVIMLLMVSQTK